MGAKPHPPSLSPQCEPQCCPPYAPPQIARSMRLRLTLLVATWLLLSPALTGGAMLAGQDASPYVPLGTGHALRRAPHRRRRDPRSDAAYPSVPPRRPGARARGGGYAAVEPCHHGDAASARGRPREWTARAARSRPGGRRRGRGQLRASRAARRDRLDRPAPVRAGARHGERGPGSRARHEPRGRGDASPGRHTPQVRPDWFGKKDRFIAGRTAEAYVDARWKFGEVFFGDWTVTGAARHPRSVALRQSYGSITWRWRLGVPSCSSRRWPRSSTTATRAVP